MIVLVFAVASFYPLEMAIFLFGRMRSLGLLSNFITTDSMVQVSDFDLGRQTYIRK